MNHSRRGSNAERELMKILESRGYHCERVAGSGINKKSVSDIVAIKDGKPYLIQCKLRKRNVFYPNEFRDELRRLMIISKKCGAIPLLAIKFKGKGWKLIKLYDVPKKITKD